MPQHEGLPVAGYRPQSESNVDLVNQNKAAEERLLRQLDHHQTSGKFNFDRRWLAIARTHLEQAFMAWNRAIFQPARVDLPEDKPLSYQDRVRAEYSELSERLGKLQAFFVNPIFADLPEADRALLRVQRDHMEAYAEALVARITRF